LVALFRFLFFSFVFFCALFDSRTLKSTKTQPKFARKQQGRLMSRATVTRQDVIDVRAKSNGCFLSQQQSRKQRPGHGERNNSKLVLLLLLPSAEFPRLFCTYECERSGENEE